MNKLKVLAAMSGGVDSSTAAALLVEQGHEVVGVTMKLYSGAGGKASLKSCCGFGPAFDAKRVADKIGIRHIVLDAETEFREKVIDDFCGEYAAGRTPNPCVRCNTFLKFDLLVQKARSLGLDYVATGHYALIRENRLFKSPDAGKDQSYFLYPLNPETLPRVLFPVGGLKKEETRARARALGLPVYDKTESQDICFMPRGGYREFLESRGRAGVRGFIFTTRGEVVGEHEGLHRYTVGQRKGLGPLGSRTYVVEIDPSRNAVVVGSREDLLSAGVRVRDFTVCCDPVDPGASFGVRIRYRAPVVPCRVESAGENRWTFRFDSPAEAVAPGQSAVLYRGDEVIGGGIIEGRLPNTYI